jgi:hypothetical protein
MENWQRLEKVVKWAGMSVNAFALHIGLKRSENLYQIKKGNHGISKELANIISTKYPQISRSWLLTGEGEMLKDGSEESPKRGIPFYNVDIASVIEFKQQPAQKPLYYIDVPIFYDCDFAALSTSNAMTPDIPAGAILAIKQHDPDKIFPGESYLVVTKDFSGIRTIRSFPSDPGKIRLVPKNLTDYDEMVIDTSEIKVLYLVKGIIIGKTL